VVLDPTPNPRLDNLVAAFKARGGDAFVGNEAWAHLEAEAGEVMATFIEKYVRTPVGAVTAFEGAEDANAQKGGIRLLDLRAQLTDGNLILTIGDHVRRIDRLEDPAFLADPDDADDD
jgi:hypothetical protein